MDKLKTTRNHSCDRYLRLKEIADLTEVEHVEIRPKKTSKQTSESELDSDIVDHNGVKIRKSKATRDRVLSESEVDALPEAEVTDDFIFRAMSKAFDPETNTLRDLKIDDSELPLASNYYDFCANHAGKNIKMPFARQLWVALLLFGEVCPRCTHPKAFVMENVPVDADPHVLARKMVLLHNGRCRKCGVSKNALLLSGEIMDYAELVLVLGQRAGKCLTRDTWLTTEDGLITVGDLERLNRDSRGTLGFSAYSGPRLSHESALNTPSHFYRAGKTEVYEVVFSNGIVLRGTPEHPIRTAEGWTQLKDLKPGMFSPTRLGLNVWGAHTSLQLAIDSANSWEKVIPASDRRPAHRALNFPVSDMTPQLAGLLAFFVTEGISYGLSSLRISNNDQDVLGYCEQALLTNTPGLRVNRTHNLVGFTNIRAGLFYDHLLDGQLSTTHRSADYFIPRSIMCAPKHIVVEYLRCAFEGDGGVNGHYVEYSTISRKLATQMQQLLLNLGIHARVKTSKTWATNGGPNQVSKDGYAVFLGGQRDLRSFEASVGFMSARKRRSLAAITWSQSNSEGGSSASLDDRLPPHYVNRLRACVDRIDLQLRTFVVPGTSRSKVSIRYLGIKPSQITTRYKVELLVKALKSSGYWKQLLKEDRAELLQVYSIVSNPERVWLKIESCRPLPRKENTYDVCIPDGHRFMSNGVISHNSTLAATLVCYALHRMCKAPKLSSMANGIQDFTPLTGSFIALTATKAIKLLWNPIRDMIAASQWFDDYFELLRHTGRRMGKELVQFSPTGTYLRLFPKSLDFYPEGPSKRTLRGATRVIAGIDELGHFPYDLHALEEDYEDERERANADEVHTVVATSLATVRTEVMRLYKKDIYVFPQGLFLNLSSPASFKDKIMRLYEESKSSELTLGVKAATWEISPMYTRDHPIIVDAYRRNQRRADRDFGANPPALTSSVFDKASILQMFHLQRLHALVYANTAEKTRGKLVNVVERTSYPPAVLSLDAGLTNNAFGLTLLYQVGREIFVPTVLEIVPAKGTKIDFVAAYDQVIYPLIKFCNVKVVYADRWNSIHILQSIEEDFKGTVTAKQYSLRAKDFDAFIDFVSTGNLHLPALELPSERIEAVLDYKKELINYPASHLFLQFLTVQLENGQLIKGSNNTDDIFRSLVLGVTRMFDPKLTEHLGKFKAAERETQSDRAVVLVGGRGHTSLSGYALEGARPPSFERFADASTPTHPLVIDVSDLSNAIDVTARRLT